MKIEIRETKEPGFVQITTIDERWYLREKDGRLFSSVTWIADYYPKGIEFYKWLASKGWDEAQAIKEEAGRKGDRVHNAINALISTKLTGNKASIEMNESYPDQNGEVKEFTVEEWECLMSFKSWWEENNPEIISQEQVCYNEEEGYAGTLDFKCRIEDKIWIVDFKTGQSLWPSHELQVSAYKHTPEGECDALGILQLGYRRNKKRWKFTEVEDKFDLFLAAMKMWHNENKDVQPRQFEYPTTITI